MSVTAAIRPNAVFTENACETAKNRMHLNTVSLSDKNLSKDKSTGFICQIGKRGTYAIQSKSADVVNGSAISPNSGGD